MKPLPPHLIFELLVQLAILLFMTRTLAELARRFNQPGVLGELVAGILLGPTVLGRIAPGVKEAIFPLHVEHGIASVQVLESFSWLGMVLLLFLIGAETDVRDLVRLGKASFLVAGVGLIVPFGAGITIGYLLPPALIPEKAPRGICAAFLATSLSISAMPVIAKIMQDLGLTKRDVGIITLGASVFDDTVGWMILAVIASLAAPTAASAPITSTLGWTTVYVVGFLGASQFLVLPILKRATHYVDDRFKSPGSDVALYSAFGFAFAAITDHLGIHAVFGAFIAGTLVRQVPRLREEALHNIEAVVSSVLSPIFFAFAGLKVDLGAGGGLGLAAIVLVVAVVTKLIGCTIGGRLGGLTTRQSMVIGAAMSARGAMGLIVAVVGQNLGILTPTLYSVVVLMAIGTTLIAPILLRTLGKDLPLEEHEKKRLEEAASEHVLQLKAPKFLVATGGGTTASTLIAVASGFCTREGSTLNVTHVDDPEKPTENLDAHLDGLKKVAGTKGVKLAVSKREHADVATAVLAEAKGKDLLLVGSSRGNALKEQPLARMVNDAPCHAVAILLRNAPPDGKFKKLLIPTDGTVFTRAALEFALAYAELEDAQVELVKAVVNLKESRGGPNIVRYLSGPEADDAKKEVAASLQSVLAHAKRPVKIHAMKGPDTIRALHAHAQGGGYDLLVIGAERQATGVHVFSHEGAEKLFEVPYSVAVVVPRL